MAISIRLQKLARASAGACVLADVGCDHGYAALEVMKQNHAAKAVLIDTNSGPLSIAAENMKKSDVLNRCSFYLSDGLRGLVLPDAELKEGERKKRERFWVQHPETYPAEPGGADDTMPDTILISGMGGRLIRDILCLLPTNGDISCDRELLLKRAVSFLSGIKKLVLSPQSEPDILRHFLIDELGAEITDEEMLYEDGKYYVIITAKPGTQEIRDTERYRSEWDYENGVILAEKKDRVYRDYLQSRKEKLSALLDALSAGVSDASQERVQELFREMTQIDICLRKYE